MAKGSFRLELNSKGIRDFYMSSDVEKLVAEHAAQIESAAGGAPDFEASVERVGGSPKLGRVMGYVTTANYEGRRAEAEGRALTRALDAGRG